MFVRIKPSGNRKYLQIVENYRDGKKVKQRVIVTLGRAEQLINSGKTDGLAKSMVRFCRQVKLVEGHRNGTLQAHSSRKIGPSLIFERLWSNLGIADILGEELSRRKFEYSVERAVFLTVLHRLFSPGSDRAAEKWKRDYKIEDADNLELHHLYRGMVWLGENYPAIEEKLFQRGRDLFSSLDLVFFDTTSIYFEGEGGDLGKRGHSKDHRPDLKQMIVGAVIDKTGRPVCCEMWPGNMSDAKALLPVVERMKKRFGVGRVTFIADRGMVSKKTIEELEASDTPYILGARMRNEKLVKVDVLSRPGRFRKVDDTLQVKEAGLDGRRYVICFNPGEAKKDAADRKTIIAALQDKLKQGAKSMIGNKGYRKYLKIEKGSANIDYEKMKSEARYDGKYVLVTNLSREELDTAEVALRYKELWQVEQLFRSLKSVLNTRPIYHQNDASIKGHIFCSFLALKLMKELQLRILNKGWKLEWGDIKRDLEALCEVELEDAGQTYRLRTDLAGICGKVFRAAGVAIPPTVRN